MVQRKNILSVVSGLAVSAALLTLAGCGASGDGAGDDALAALTKSVKEQERANKALLDRLDRIERKIDGHTEDIDRLSRQRVTAELASAEAAPADVEGEAGNAAAAGTPAGDVDLTTLLETEDGQAAVEKAMAAVQQKRDAERRERWVGMMIDRFATDANLTDAQADDMRRVVSSSFKQIGELWTGMRGDATSPDERAVQREEAMVKMEEIRARTNDEVKAILTPDQYLIYEEQSARMRNFGGAGGAGRGGRGDR